MEQIPYELKLNIMKKMKKYELKNLILTNNEFYSIYLQNKDLIRMNILWNTYGKNILNERMEKYITILNKNMIKFFIENGANINYDFFVVLIKYNKFDIIKYIIENNIKSRQLFENKLKNLLIIAAEYGNFEIVKYFVKYTFIVNKKSNFIEKIKNNLENLETLEEVLLIVSRYDNVDIIKFLVDKGLSTEAIEEAFINSASEGNFNVVKYFVEIAGVNIHYNDDIALMYSVEHKHNNISKYLIDMGSNVNAQNGEILIESARTGNFEIFEYLLKKGANIVEDTLIQSAAEDHLNIVKYILTNYDTFINIKHIRKALRMSKEYNAQNVSMYLQEKLNELKKNKVK